jgi:hypothetical protein
MTAWKVTKTWDASRIKGYRQFIMEQGPKRIGNTRFTCEDLAIRLVTEFAAAEGLPLAFANDAHPAGLSPTGFADKDKFLDVVLTSTGASDLLTYRTVKPVPGSKTSNPNSVKQQAYRYDAKAGEWLYSGSHSDVFKDHGQVVIWNFAAWNQLAPSTR